MLYMFFIAVVLLEIDPAIRYLQPKVQENHRSRIEAKTKTKEERKKKLIRNVQRGYRIASLLELLESREAHELTKKLHEFASKMETQK